LFLKGKDPAIEGFNGEKFGKMENVATKMNWKDSTFKSQVGKLVFCFWHFFHRL